MKFELDRKYEKLTLIISVVLVLFVSITGYWVYSKLSSVSNSMAGPHNQDSRLILLKDLNNDMVLAENYSFSYSITRKDSLLTKFYLLESGTRMKMHRLRTLPSGDPKYFVYIDTLQSLVNQRFRTMEDVVLVQNENRVNDAMDQVIHEVKTMARPDLRKPTEIPKVSDKKERFRLFKTRAEKKAKEDEKIRKSATVNATAINAGLQRIKTDVVQDEQQKNARKLVVEQRNNILIARFTQIIQTIENQEKKVAQREAEKATQITKETNVVIAVFCFTSVLLILLAGYLIYTFIQKTKETNAQLMIAKQKSDQLTQSKSQFLANMSHELRTPLNAIVGFTEQLRSAKLPAGQQEKIDIIGKAADHLTQITNEILDFSKLNAEAVQLESIPFIIREELAFVKTAMQDLADKNENSLNIETDENVPACVKGDPMRLKQVLINLTGNALKFTHRGAVTIRIKPILQSHDETSLSIDVSDTGIGISEENLSRIFDEFEQAESSTSRNFGGTGLGLSITKMLVEKMGGTIAVKSRLGKGTTFTVTIPFDIYNEELAPVAETVTADLSPFSDKTILVVDDEPFNRKLLRSILEGANIRMTETANGLEAIEELEKTDYDLVLLDLRMPKMDGFEAIKKIRHLRHKKELPVIALTAAIDQEERKKMLAGDWNGILLKPFKLNELSHCLEEVFLSVSKPVKTRKKSSHSHHSAIDLSSLKELAGEDSAFYKEMLETFLDSTRNGLDGILSSVEKHDYPAAGAFAHKMSAPVKQLNGMKAYQHIQKIEIEAKNPGSEFDFTKEANELKTTLEPVFKTVEEEIEKV